MELLYTILFTNFIFLWFSRYNFITFVLLLLIFTIIRNVRLYMLQNNLNETPNPFLNGIKYLFNGVNWVTSKIFNGNSYLSEKIPFIGYINNKYIELNNYFLEFLGLSKKHVINQLLQKFNYTLLDISRFNKNMITNKNTNLINEKKTTQEIIDLNNEYRKKNAILINLNNQIMPTLNNIISSFDKLKKEKDNLSEKQKQDNKNQDNKEDNNQADNDQADNDQADNDQADNDQEDNNQEDNNQADNDQEDNYQVDNDQVQKEKNIYLYDSDEDSKKNN